MAIRRLATCVLCSFVGLLVGNPAWAQAPGAGDWATWRGPTGNGVAAAGQTPPTRWSDSEGIAWKTELSGRGHSSPTVVRDRVYLTTADEQAKTQSALAFDRASGKLVWQKELSQGGFPKTHSKNTHATPTIACDGERLFVVFHHHDKVDAMALTLEGEIAWRRDLGAFIPTQYEYGYAPSPALYGDLVLIAAEFDGAGAGYLTALARKTGDVVWKTPRPKQTSYSSPIVGKVAGRDQLLISGCNLVSAFDPASGKSLWSTPGTTAATCGTMVWEGDTVFASGGYPKSETLCVKADGSGQVLWKNNQKCYEQSMLVHEGHVYALNDNGIAFCWRGQDGAEMWKERLRGPVSSSPVLAGGNIYQTDEHGTTYVFKPTPARFELVSKNQLGVEGFATLAICNSEIFIRIAEQKGGKRQEALVCLRAK